MNGHNAHSGHSGSAHSEQLDKALVECVRTVNRGSNGKAPTAQAIADGVALARSLLLQGARVNAKDRDRSFDSPLHVAAAEGSQEMARLLLEFGANMELKNVLGYTPLVVAAKNAQKSMALWLITEGANTDTFLGDRDLKVAGFNIGNMTRRQAAMHALNMECLRNLLNTEVPQTPTDNLPGLMKRAKAMRNKEPLAMLQSLQATMAIEGLVAEHAQHIGART